MSQKKRKSSIPYKQLQQENKVLGNIISTLKTNKHQLEKHNEELQRRIHQITHHQTSTKLENQALRNITAELKNKLSSLCGDDHDDDGTLQPPQLPKYNTNAVQPKLSNSDKSELLEFLQNTSNRINQIESNLCTKTIPIERQADTENRIHCLKQEIHQLEMGKLDLLKHNQQCVVQLQDMIQDQQSLQHKLCYLENENTRLRQCVIENDASFTTQMKEKDTENHNRMAPMLSTLSFEDLIQEVQRIEKENQHQKDIKEQLIVLNEENQRLREQLIEKQNENQSLFDKYNVTLKQYELLSKSYLK
eukprot:103951_1